MEYLMRKFVLAASALSAFTAVPALAQETNPTFTGPRIEATLGYDHVGAGSSTSNNNGRDDQKIDGLLYGGGIGYDVAVGSLLVGAEGEITGSTARNSQNSYTSTFGYGRVKQGRDLYAGARIGILASPTTMIYAKGGYTNARLDLTRNNTQVTTDRHFNLDGYRVGAGVEQSVGGKAYLKAEYRYSNYGDARLEYANGANTDNFSVDTDRHQVVVGAGIRF